MRNDQKYIIEYDPKNRITHLFHDGADYCPEIHDLTEAMAQSFVNKTPLADIFADHWTDKNKAILHKNLINHDIGAPKPKI